MIYRADVKGQAELKQHGHMGQVGMLSSNITNQYDGHTLVKGMMKSFNLR